MPQAFPANHGALPFIELQLVDSTNNYARRMIHEGLAQHGIAIFSHEQTEGRGQRSKTWSSEKNSNLLMSILIDPSGYPILNGFHLTACVAMTVHQLFSKKAGDDTKIKWPNDLYWQDRKAGGILIENVISTGNMDHQSNWSWSIIGCGININQVSFDDQLGRPVSLKQITGRDHNPLQLAVELQSALVENFSKLIGNGPTSALEYYNEHLFRKGEFAFFKKDNRRFEAKVLEVDSHGDLIIEHAIRESIHFGEVEWII